jgi:hypothetical protein
MPHRSTIGILTHVALSIVLVVAAAAQTTPAPSGPIQDNSFLIEEAYNQEAGVIQHISTFTRLWNSRDWAYSFTEEWPVPGHERHQLSATVSLVSPGAFQGTGLGDALLNYRYQLVGNGEARIAVAPRASLIAPSGKASLGRGFGGFGVQVNVPASVVLTKQVVAHWNAGATVVPSARDASGNRAALSGYNLGQGLVWLAKPRFNVLVETLWTTSQAVAGPGRTEPKRAFLLNPGVRWSHNFKSGLQIVPGIGVPIGVGPSSGERGIFVYLSFEHPLAAIGRR